LYGNSNPIRYVDPSGYASENDPVTGNFLHNTIGAHFLAAAGIWDLTNPMNPDRGTFAYSRVYEPRFPLNLVANTPTFLRVARTATGMPHHPGIPGYNGSSPDLTDFDSKELYEIKPQGNTREINVARQKLDGAIDALGWMGYGMNMMGFPEGRGLTGWHKGDLYVPPPIIPLSAGRFAVVKLLEPGMIVYKIHNPGRLIAAATVTALAIQELIVAFQAALARNSRTPVGGLI